jgi:shikimate kinase
MHRPDRRQESTLPPTYSGSSIVLIGPTGVGKSSVGQALARQLDLPFLDSDQVINRCHGTITEMFVTLGEPAFRQIESETIASLVSSQSVPAVLSVGGGAILDPATRRLFRDLTVVWLDTELEYVLPRLLAQPNRPLLRGDVAEKWQRYASARHHLYDDLADVKIDARKGSVENLAETITRRLLERS